MVMRYYWGCGIGHTYARTRLSVPTPNPPSSSTPHTDEALGMNVDCDIDRDIDMGSATGADDILGIDSGDDDPELLLDDREQDELSDIQEFDDIRDDDLDGELDWEADVAMYEMYGEDYND